MVPYRCAIPSTSLHLVSNVATSCTRFWICSSCFLLILTKSRFSIRMALACSTPQSGSLGTFANGEVGNVGEIWPFIENPWGGGGGKLSWECKEGLSSLDGVELKATGGNSSGNASFDVERFNSKGSCFSGWEVLFSWDCPEVWKRWTLLITAQ